MAKKRKQPWLAGEDIMLLVDRKSHGRRTVILGVNFGDDTWIAFSVQGSQRSALDVASLITKGVLSN